MAKPFKVIVLAAGGLLLTSAMVYVFSPKDVNKGFRYFVNNTIGTKCIDYKQTGYSNKLTDKIPDYIGKSSIKGITRCKDEKEIMKKVSARKLVEVKSQRGLVVEKMSHSYPYLTAASEALLMEICRRMKEKTSGTRLRGLKIRVTSMTRTTEQLRSLRDVNSNASLNSPHLYGNAFDISYMRFSTRKWFLTNCDKKYLKETLAAVIWELRSEKKCWATYERQQSCFHVVSR